MTNVVLDLETSINTSKKRKANPFDKRNRVIMSGWKVDDAPAQGKYFRQYSANILPELAGVDVVIGFNFKFDMLYFWEDENWIQYLQRGGKIWCCQYAEFLLGGMSKDVQMVALEDIALKAGGTKKLDVVKEMWAQGIATEDIPEQTLTAYLLGCETEGIEGDIDSTYRVYQEQLKRIQALENPQMFWDMLQGRFDGLLCTTSMEWNGLYVDAELAEVQRQEQIDLIAENERVLDSFIPVLPEEVIFNWGSPFHKSAIIFGGPIKYDKWTPHLTENDEYIYPKKTVKWPLFTGIALDAENTLGAKFLQGLWWYSVPVGTIGAIQGTTGHWLKQDCFKSGLNQGLGKFKNVQVDNLDKPKGCKKPYAVDLAGYVTPKPEWALKNTDCDGNPVYSTDKKIMEILAGMQDVPFCAALSQYATSVKDLSTYYWVEEKVGVLKGMLTLVYPDGLIHHKLNHVNVVTGRLSSSDPNLQNITRKDKSKIKRVFKSRFGSEGKLVVIDYKQIEILCQAILSGDENLIADIRNKIDFHCKRLSTITNRDYEELLEAYLAEDDEVSALRTKAKGFSFQRAFGAGPTAIAAETGLNREVVKELIKAEGLLYPGVEMFDLKLQEHINNNATGKVRVVTKEGVKYGKYATWQSPTGTIYKWTQHEAPEWLGTELAFSPTERKNYPVQGLAGEIVETVLGLLFRWWLTLPDNVRKEFLLINTVHDSIIIDAKIIWINKYMGDVIKIVESVEEIYKRRGITLPVKFTVDTTIGDDLYTMTKLIGEIT